MKNRITFVSDLHLGALGKLDEFLWDDRFAALLRHPSIAPGPGDRSELVILGDAFDLWQAVPASDCEADQASAIELQYTADVERARLEAVARRHPTFFAEIGRFAATPGCSVTFVPGNHDHSLVDAGVQAALRRACGLGGEDPRLGFALSVDRPELGLWAEHGNQADPNNRYSAFERFDPESECRGYPFVRLFWNRIEYLDPALQNNGSYWHAVWRHLSDRKEWRIFALAIRYFRQYWNDPRVRARLTPFEAGADPRVTLDGAPTLLAAGRAAPGRLFAPGAEAERLFREAYQVSPEVRAEIDAACAEAGRPTPGAEELGAPVVPGATEAILPLGPPRDVAAAGDLGAGRSTFPARARAYSTVVTGHTHVERDQRLESGTRYLNTGAWSRGGDLPAALVEWTGDGRPEASLLHLLQSGELMGRGTTPAHEVSSAHPGAREAATPRGAIALILHAPEDEAFVASRLVPALLWNGFDRWASVPSGSPEAGGLAARSCDAVLVVVSADAARAAAVGAQVEQALAAGIPVVPVVVDETRPGNVHHGLEPLPAAHQPPLEPSGAADDDARALADLLAPIRPRSSSPAAAPASCTIHPVDWNEGRFSAVLAGAVRRRDEARLQQLIAAFEEHSEVRPWPYPFGPARADLLALRGARRFRAMRRYAEAAIASGTRDAEVRRQYGQALIELGEFGRAIGVLEAIASDSGAHAEEVREAYGLLGRAYKQMYVNAPGKGAGDLLVRAIAAYRTIYDRDAQQVWHGINAASCMQRAGRDGVSTARASEVQEMADRILETLAAQERQAPLFYWDLATRFEALALLGRSAEASAALDRYLAHPGTNAFAVSSTHRQCTELLQLDRLPWGASLVDRLWRMVERYRAGGLADEMRGGLQTRPLLIRVTDAAWSPPVLPGLQILSRLGTVISARGDDAAVRALLGDAEVMAVEESRPGGTCECLTSVPFVRADRVHAPPLGERGSLALVAVVDDGIDVLHQAFSDDQGRSRIEAVWDQRDPTGPAPPGFSYGTFHGPADLARYLAQGAVPPGLGRDPSGHGTHVASIAAGRAVQNFAGGVAPEARLVVVISARREVGVGFKQSYHDALAFIDGFAGNRPVVVNISQGTHAGAHDGSSSLEAAFDQFTGSGLREGHIVVKSAGNDQVKGVHAKIAIGPQAVEELPWTRPPASSAPREHIELWFSSSDELAFRLADPAGRWTDVVDVANQVRKGVLGTDGYSAEYQKWHPNNGASQLRIDLQAAPRTSLQSGDWRLEIRSATVREGVVHAWIECDDGPPTRFARHATSDTTLSIPGTAERVITVGAVDKSDPVRLAPESSFGPTRDGRLKPDLAAPGIAILAAEAGTQAGVRAATGTSQAAPHVAGAVALLLSRRARAGLPGLTSSQIAAALRQRTRNPNATWQATSGWGVLDAEALLMAF